MNRLATVRLVDGKPMAVEDQRLRVLAVRADGGRTTGFGLAFAFDQEQHGSQFLFVL